MTPQSPDAPPTGWLKNCHVVPRPDNKEPWIFNTINGTVVCRLDGYAIIPIEQARAPVSHSDAEYVERAMELAEVLGCEYRAAPSVGSVIKLEGIVAARAALRAHLQRPRQAAVQAEPVEHPFGWLMEGPKGYRQFGKATDTIKPVFEMYAAMAKEHPDKYKWTPLYTSPPPPTAVLRLALDALDFAAWAKRDGYGQSLLWTHAKAGWDAAITSLKAAIKEME